MNREANRMKLCSVLRADFETGKLFWLPRDFSEFETVKQARLWQTRFANKQAFTAVNGTGYIHGNFERVSYQAHRVIWLLYTGEWPNIIDHINGKRSDNRIVNLRSVDTIGNSKNRKVRSDSTSGVTGVVWHKKAGKWQASIQADGNYKHLGLFENVQEAAIVRKVAEATYGFHENHGRPA